MSRTGKAAKPLIKLAWGTDSAGKQVLYPRNAPMPMRGRDASRGAPGMASLTPTLLNPTTGLGGNLDHSSSLAFRDIYLDQYELEIVYRNSWVVQKMVNIPVNDMFTPGRAWTGDNREVIEKMEAAEAELGVLRAVKNAMKCATLYGTGLLVILSKDQDPEEELDPEKVTEGSIANLLVLDHFRADIDAWVIDPKTPRYGLPYMYRITPLISPQESLINVHHSRVIRFDGVEALQTEGWMSNIRDWGVSKVNATINEVAREEAMQVGVDHLIQEASIQVMKTSGFKDALMAEDGRADRDMPSLSELAQAQTLTRSLFRIMFTDREDETDRLAVQFAGIPDLLERKLSRVAAMYDVPLTRFLGISPGGLNSTGDSDMLNYSVRLESERNSFMAADGMMLDRVVAAHAGLAEPPESEWRPIFQISPDKQADMYSKESEAIARQAEVGNIDENDARSALSNMPEWFGELPEWDDAEVEGMRQAINPTPEPAETSGGNQGE